jgi:diguanylate cyclase (GGDEF)-like protein
MSSWPRKTLEIVIRNQVTLLETAAVLAAMLLAGALLLEFDLFGGVAGGTNYAKTIDLTEALTFMGLLCVGLLYMAARHIQRLKREVDQRVAAERQARVLAFHDALTNLPNRRTFDQALSEAILTLPGGGGAHAVFMLDLNGFKRINDVFGHHAGDDVLVGVAHRLQAAVRKGDLVSRFGGDEFAVLATHLAGAEEATSIAMRMIRSLEEPIAVGSVRHAVGLGIGIAMIPNDGQSAEEVVRKADIALYRAKSGAGSAMCFFAPEMDAHIRERATLERKLRVAVETGLIEPYYQPQFDLATNEIVGFEALARWHDEALGDVPPDRFIPVAEECDLIDQLSEQLLRKVCADALNWPSSIRVSFNISSRLFRNRTFGLRVMAILGETGLAPGRLELELTESALVRDLPAVKETLGALRRSGVRLALDDFGTGYSSFYHLRNLPVDRIKIDRSFIETIASEPESSELVQAMLGLGHGLGMTVTAEGIEQPDQLAALLSQGCKEGQGFLFSEAIPAAAATLLLRTPKKVLAT